MKKLLTGLVALALPVLLTAQDVSEDYYYYLRNVWSGSYAASNGNTVIPLDKSEAAPYLWRVKKQTDGTVYLINKATGTAAYPTEGGDQAIKLGQEYAWTLE